MSASSNHIDKITRLCSVIKSKASRIEPMNFVLELEFLGCQLEKFDLNDIKLDELNRNDLDRVRNALKTSFLTLSNTPELTNLWNTVMAKGPDSISGGDMPSKGTTFNTWLDAMIVCANGIRESMLKLLP